MLKRLHRPATSAADALLVQRVRAGDDRAFEEVVRRYRPTLERYAARLLAGRALDPEDVVQESFVRALRSLCGGAQEVELRPWLYRIVRNACFDELRRPRHDVAPILDTDIGGHAGELHARAALRETLREVLGDLAELPDHQRIALQNRALGGLSHAENARALGVSPAASKMLVHRARSALHSRRTACAA